MQKIGHDLPEDLEEIFFPFFVQKDIHLFNYFKILKCYGLHQVIIKREGDVFSNA
jgi:hypothetical protein